MLLQKGSGTDKLLKPVLKGVVDKTSKRNRVRPKDKIGQLEAELSRLTISKVGSQIVEPGDCCSDVLITEAACWGCCLPSTGDGCSIASASFWLGPWC